MRLPIWSLRKMLFRWVWTVFSLIRSLAAISRLRRPETDLVDDLGLPLRQMAVGAAPGHAEVGEARQVLERMSGHEPVRPDFSCGDGSDRAHDRLEIQFLSDEPRSARPQDPLDGVGSRAGGEDEEAGRRRFAPKAGDHVFSARAERFEVEEQDAGLLAAQKRPDSATRRRPGRRQRCRAPLTAYAKESPGRAPAGWRWRLEGLVNRRSEAAASGLRGRTFRAAGFSRGTASALVASRHRISKWSSSRS